MVERCFPELGEGKWGASAEQVQNFRSEDRSQQWLHSHVKGFSTTTPHAYKIVTRVYLTYFLEKQLYKQKHHCSIPYAKAYWALRYVCISKLSSFHDRGHWHSFGMAWVNQMSQVLTIPPLIWLLFPKFQKSSTTLHDKFSQWYSKECNKHRFIQHLDF